MLNACQVAVTGGMHNQRKRHLLLVVEAVLAASILVTLMLLAMWFTGHL
jgi:hypothetical protein